MLSLLSLTDKTHHEIVEKTAQEASKPHLAMAELVKSRLVPCPVSPFPNSTADLYGTSKCMWTLIASHQCSHDAYIDYQSLE
ncbi:hypothetical protein VFPPC_05125 [Pochonia chlamydosporia 170]|uniref:Uncharacterized protein n=1 Tax=Pochonia chlamydosporia 170 TaxID=1380566 RepID=A0A179FVG0_METCM|nr:hypothetical protein VFPPC_05125 [Pochonia chlamydosporia 170]OAQ68979.2 hypothetical protein VFPPC_05125 [Pochonia chlamydosporia 170]